MGTRQKLWVVLATLIMGLGLASRFGGRRRSHAVAAQYVSGEVLRVDSGERELVLRVGLGGQAREQRVRVDESQTAITLGNSALPLAAVRVGDQATAHLVVGTPAARPLASEIQLARARTSTIP